MNKEIRRLAIPNIISNVSIPLLGLADLAIMGHTSEVANMGAVSLGGVIFSYLYWGFAFLRMGTSGITAQAYGSNSSKLISTTLSRALLLAIVGGILLIIIQNPIISIAIKALDASTDVENLVVLYFKIRIFAAPAAIANYALSGWYIGMQNSKIPMTVTIISNLLNILLNYVLVFNVNMGVKGIALATVISQYTGVIIYLMYLIFSYRKYLIDISFKEILNISELKMFLDLNLSIFFRTMCVIIVLSFIQARSAKIDNNILAVSALIQQFTLFFSFFIDGVAYAAESITGKYVGSSNFRQLNKAIKALFVWGTVILLFFTFTYYFFATNIVELLTSISSVKNAFSQYAFWVVIIPISSFAAFIWDGIYIGATAGRLMLYTMLIATFIFFFPIYFLTNTFLHAHSLWLALCSFFLARGILQTILYKKVMQNTLQHKQINN